jgi:hypothetical protein
MHSNRSAFRHIFRTINGRLALLAVFTAGVALSFACEDKSIGRQCTLATGDDPTQGIYATRVAECPSRICVKPGIQVGVGIDLDTAPYCSAFCSTDDDCDGQTRESDNPNDKRCKKGFTCAIPFGKGEAVSSDATQSLCCAKVCLCRDFFLQSIGPAVPTECTENAGEVCK